MKYDILRYEKIPVANVRPHPKNPRPTFHLRDEDPNLQQLANSIRIEGQTTPAFVYELVGHYELADEPGKYMLLQGERRWRACRIGEVETLSCNVVPTPQSEAEEYVWLGIEEAFKLPWQPFFLLQFAWNQAQLDGVSVVSPEIQAKTGLSARQLRVADSLFRLEPEILAMVKEYEQIFYETMTNGRVGRRRSRMVGSGVNTAEFPTTKAALVFDIFKELRDHCQLSAVKDRDDLELQRTIASRATKPNTTIRQLQEFLASAKALSQPGKAQTKHLTAVQEMLELPTKNLKDINRRVGIDGLKQLDRLRDRCVAMTKEAEAMTRRVSTMTDVDFTDYQRIIIRMVRTFDRLDREMDEQSELNGARRRHVDN